MKKVIFFSVFVLLMAGRVQASEIFGRISTNPGAIMGEINSGANQTTSNGAGTKTTSAEKKSINTTQKTSKNSQTSDATKKSSQNSVLTKKIKVLGVSFYPENSLLRADGRRVFLIRKGYRKPILSLKDLKKYSGQTIFNVSNEEMGQYQIRPNLEGELIREKGQSRVFVIVEGHKKPVLSVAELRSRHRNDEISNISHEEMSFF